MGEIPSSGLLVGCQSIGCMRSSNWDEGLNFHFLIIVQMTATPPMDDAMTMRTVKVVFLVDAVALAAAAEREAVADSACPVAVRVMVWVLSGVLAANEWETPTRLIDWEVWGAEVVEGEAEVVVSGTDEVAFEMADEDMDDEELPLVRLLLVMLADEATSGVEDAVVSVADDDSCDTVVVVESEAAELVDEACKLGLLETGSGSGATPMRPPRF